MLKIQSKLKNKGRPQRTMTAKGEVWRTQITLRRNVFEHQHFDNRRLHRGQKMTMTMTTFIKCLHCFKNHSNSYKVSVRKQM